MSKSPFETRVLFMGTPKFAETILSSIVEAGYSVVAVYTQPDKPSGRDQSIIESPVKIFAKSHEIPIEQPEKLDEVAAELFRAYAPDIVIVAAYGKILPESLLSIPPLGCVNIHASLLPRWRGSSPVQNAILAGDKETGVTIMRMDRGMDTGPIFEQKSIQIDPDDTTETLVAKLAQEGSNLLISILPSLIEKNIESKPQDEKNSTLCQLVERNDGKVFWSEEAEIIYNRYRALMPWPGIFSFWKKKVMILRIKLWKISLQKHNPETKHAMGQVFEIGESIGIQTGHGVIILEEVQLEGKDKMSITEFIQGYPDFIGSVLE